MRACTSLIAHTDGIGKRNNSCGTQSSHSSIQRRSRLTTNAPGSANVITVPTRNQLNDAPETAIASTPNQPAMTSQ
jgi:hypothetical protein